MKSRILLCSAFFASLITGISQTIPVPETLWRLVGQEDTDGDRRITVKDRVTPFELRSGSGTVVRRIEGAYPQSVLLQELKRAEDRHDAEIGLEKLRLDEPVVDRTHRLIRDVYWDALTRRIDAAHVDEVVHDSKVASKYDAIYVPASDTVALEYFQHVQRETERAGRSPALRVIALPAPGQITASFVRALDGSHGLLSLKLELDSAGRPVGGVPYVVPGGRFNELYYWDSYFIVLGLVQDGRTDLARGMADNMLYAMQHYGKIPNGNRTYYLTRSQPPFLTSILRAVYEAKAADRTWLEAALPIAIAEYRNVWLGSEHLVSVRGHRLSRYFGSGDGPCPEVEIGHYDEKLEPWRLAARTPGTSTPSADAKLPTPFQFLNEYLYCGKYAGVQVNGLTLDRFFKHDRAVRESGHDTTHRFNDRTADFVTVDLNSLLFKYEMDFAEILEKEFGGSLPSLGKDDGDAAFWRRQAAARREAMMDLMWDEEHGFFFDYDAAHGRRSTYISATGLYPLWARVLDPERPEDLARAKRIAAFMRENLEQSGGLSATARESVLAAQGKDVRQWDYPFGWAPHQMLAWRGLRNFRLNEDAGRLAYRWLYTIARNAHDYNGTIPEKYNVVTGSHAVFAEYGNVGTKFDYIAPEGFGWMNASFQVGTNYLSPEALSNLSNLKPPAN